MPDEGHKCSKEAKNKVTALFNYIMALNKAKQTVVTDLKKHNWYRFIEDFPKDSENIRVFFRDRIQNDNTESANQSSVLISIHKPEYTKCPEPSDVFKGWLYSGWDIRQLKDVGVQDILHFNTEGNVVSEQQIQNDLLLVEQNPDAAMPEYKQENFEDNQIRVNSFNAWKKLRNAWYEKQQLIAQIREIFDDLYRTNTELARDSENLELIVANGILKDKKDSNIFHPVLTRRVKLSLDTERNVITVEDLMSDTLLYTTVFQKLENTDSQLKLDFLKQLESELDKEDYHPLDRNDTPDYLKRLIRTVTSKSYFSEDGTENGVEDDVRLLMLVKPVLILRKRLDGTLKTINNIIENIEDKNYIPQPIIDVVSGGRITIPEDTDKPSLEEQLASVGGESIDILLSKEANKEQLEIAKRIEKYNAVLVQGPPGTGKTHTIANLMGHFLAQGKRVLVTSHTSKALKVLKEKLVPEIQDLCVSIIDDSRKDMEKSIDGITEYMSKNTSFALKEKMEHANEERKQIIQKLAETRKNLYLIINQERGGIVYNGESISPSKAAEFIVEHVDDLSYIPGVVVKNAQLPLSFDELVDLYRSNDLITTDDESELLCNLPNPEELITPEDYYSALKSENETQHILHEIEESTGWSLLDEPCYERISFVIDNKSYNINYPDPEKVEQLKTYISSFEKIEIWMRFVAVDGKNGGNYRKQWEFLIKQIDDTCNYSESIMPERLGKIIEYKISDISVLEQDLKELKLKLQKKGKLGLFDNLFCKKLKNCQNSILVDGKVIETPEDCDVVLHEIELNKRRAKCAALWKQLLGKHGVTDFSALESEEPEKIASNYIPLINRYLDWYEKEYQVLLDYIKDVGIPIKALFINNPLESETENTRKILLAIETKLPYFCKAFDAVLTNISKYKQVEQSKLLLNSNSLINSKSCCEGYQALLNSNSDSYKDAFGKLKLLYSKYALQNSREDYLKRLTSVASQWADAIRNREGIHGNASLPANIEDAWKWKQLSLIISEITSKPFSELQAQSISLSRSYREITAKYAEHSAWYELLKRTESDISMMQNLQGWKLIVNRIGAGTGRNVASLREEARKLMAKCQEAVPAWIMPIGKALEMLDVKNNRFDYIIIDEASQSDVSAMAVLYMGNKFIIVGDDKQVSPMAIGEKADETKKLLDIYLKDKIPNYLLYDGKMSIYDIASTTFTPMMLQEHFRCVPEIIAYSNFLSYDNKIKPLRAASDSNLLPAVVNYRVDGSSCNKVNEKEALAIVALIKACIQQPEYKNKSFGVISMLGDEQFKKIQSLIFRYIDQKTIDERRILCGNSSNFQGDERDIIFLSLVDSNNGGGPLAKREFGNGDMYRKRYNVAASRAKDQLWVVDSLDPANDLKEGDIRKSLIDFSINPSVVINSANETSELSESVFESKVASALKARGYHIIHQWEVGAYRIDMVAVFGEKRIAIECDGERYHSSEDQIKKDMERQAILERLKWKFIRIRGSEYFSNPENTIKHVVEELSKYGIEPEQSEEIHENKTRETPLLKRVKAEAAKILTLMKEPKSDYETIEVALGGGSISTEKIGETITDILDTKVQDTVTSDNVENLAPKDNEFGVISSTNPALPAENRPVVEAKPSSNNEPIKTVKDPRIPIDKDNKTTFAVTQEPSNTNLTVKQPDLPVLEQPFNKPATQPLLPGLEKNTDSENSIIEILKKENIKYIDKRELGGAFWIIGDKELENIVNLFSQKGISFKFSQGGGKVTNKKPAWWTTKDEF